jgi:hypothetical protein
MRVRVPPPVSGGLILSYRCSAACRHCMYACSPRWPEDWISPVVLSATLRALAGRIQPSPGGSDSISLSHGLHFTGGEPFLRFEGLCEAVEIAAGLGIPSLFAETNCFWATDDGQTREKLLALRARGLAGLLISVNPFFLEFVPFERTERAVRIGSEVFGPNLVVYQLQFYRSFQRLGIRGKMPFEEFLALPGGRRFAAVTEFFLNGRSPFSLAAFELFPRYPARALLAEPCRPPFLRDWHNHFDNYGNFVPGFCGGLSLGDCRELGTLLEQGVELEGRPVLARIISGDFAGLLGLARAHGYRESDTGYLSKCHLCAEIRRHLVREQAAGRGAFPELVPLPFYENLS